MNKSRSRSSTQLLRKIDQKMSRIESILQNISGFLVVEEKYEIHQILLEVSQLLLALQQDPKMTPLVKGLIPQLQSIQEQYNFLFCRGKVEYFIF
ncbi:hypothetical protein [Bacillus mycoides]|uniref:hypothetical protein n=1 Tax=Bacillus mycoides TaxID=1405 RepID=UPI000BFCFDD7|nr:hypothetical protein [Bacillus mycoides]MCQ6530425.1 hypothetical protein [Bacillus mycoides]PGT56886.1 hypothetical protein COD14_28905 [Bacillus cereus]PGV94123.1 hypothetical protein COD86_16440 [Bacillus cereus]